MRICNALGGAGGFWVLTLRLGVPHHLSLLAMRSRVPCAFRQEGSADWHLVPRHLFMTLREYLTMYEIVGELCTHSARHRSTISELITAHSRSPSDREVGSLADRQIPSTLSV